MMAGSRRTPFVGREQELATLLAQLAAAREGHGGLVLVAGEPGIGKTRLLAELAERAGAEGWRVLVGHAYEHEGLPPYFPFIEALRGYIRDCTPPQLRRQLGQGASDVAVLIPQLRDRLPELPRPAAVSPETGRYLLYDRLSEFLFAIARAAPAGLLLVLEDLHWADAATSLLLQHLVRQQSTAPILIVATYRTVDAGSSTALPELLAELQRLDGIERLTLTPFGIADATALISGISGVAAAAPVATAILQETAGNPFFLGEVVRSLLAEGHDLSDRTALVAHQGIPEGVRQVIGRRLARLSPETHHLLQAAAVLGDGFAVDLLRASTESAYSAQEAALDEAVTAGLLRERGDEYEFIHPLVRAVLYEGLRLARRQQLHAAAAAAIERIHATNLSSHVVELATHYRLAGSSATGQALTYTVRAAEAAAAVFAWQAAARYWQVALSLVEQTAPTPTRWCDLLLARGEAQYRAGAPTESLATFEQAAELARLHGLTEHLARAAIGYAGARAKQPTAIELLTEALAELPSDDGALRAKALSLLSEHLPSTREAYRRKQALAAEAVAMARRIGDPLTLGYTLHNRCLALSDWGDLDERIGNATELILLGDEAGDDELSFIGRSHRLAASLEFGDTADAIGDIAVCVRLAEELRQPRYAVQALQFQATEALLTGRFADADRLVSELQTLARRMGGPDEDCRRSGHLIMLRREQGRFAETEAVTRECAACHPEYTGWQAALAVLDSTLGHTAEARLQFEQLAVDDFLGIRLDSYWLTTLSALVGVCADLHDVRRAAHLYALMEPYANRNIVGDLGKAACLGSVSHFLGLLAVVMGQWNTAEQHFDAALAMNTHMESPPLVVYTQHAYAAMLLTRHKRGNARRARALLKSALTTCRAVGMQHAASQIAALLRTPLFVGLRPNQAPHPDGLSDREVEVLRLLAAGKSNPEIATALVISLYTVYRHVNHILAKTGCSNRVEAATYAHRYGIVS